jgi:hypothetical protein
VSEIYKSRTEPKLLTILRVLKTRGSLNEEDEKYLQRLDKGYQGEREFDLLTSRLQSDCIIINDLLLEVNNSEYQIDTVLIYIDTFFIIDVKTMEGDYSYSPEALKTINGGEYKNPLHQLQRSKTLLKQLLHKLGYDVNIVGYVVFINPEFTLYLSPPDLPFVFPTQLKKFLQKLEAKPSRITNTHKKIAKTLVSHHKKESNNARKLIYEYKFLKKGGTCYNCCSFSLLEKGKLLVCQDCGSQEVPSATIIRMAEEISLLFPDRKITTKEVYEWTGGMISKKRISRTLRQSYKMKGFGQWAYYEKK